jgi:hypothetical protein
MALVPALVGLTGLVAPVMPARAVTPPRRLMGQPKKYRPFPRRPNS